MCNLYTLKLCKMKLRSILKFWGLSLIISMDFLDLSHCTYQFLGSENWMSYWSTFSTSFSWINFEQNKCHWRCCVWQKLQNKVQSKSSECNFLHFSNLVVLWHNYTLGPNRSICNLWNNYWRWTHKHNWKRRFNWTNYGFYCWYHFWRSL